LPAGLALVLVLITLGAAGPAGAESEPTGNLEIGRRIYEQGILGDGSPLQGLRYGSDKVEGAEAACTTCHRRSGLGAVEGDIQVSPVTGKFLFGGRGLAIVNMDPRVGKRFNQRHAPYTHAALSTAIRSGKNVGGAEMNPMMPRYTVGDSDMKALIAYLDQLSAQWSPGADAEVVHLATVITPEVARERKKAVVDMIETIVAQKNNTTRLRNDPRGRRHMVSAAEFVLGTERKWNWHLWELSGAPETWEGQLRALQAQQPVFALVSSLTETTFEPIHRFCQSQKVPCWFPNVDATGSDEDFYSLYFSRGVTLEADALAQYWRDAGGRQPSRLVQIYRAGPVGETASQALAKALEKTGTSVVNKPLPAGERAALSKALKGVAPGDSVMLWLRRDELSALKGQPPAGTHVFVSGQLAGGEGAPLPGPWKSKATMIYPYELPAKRQGSLESFHAWMLRFKQPMVDEALQSQTYFSMTYLAETLGEMLDNLHRDYLLERAESMLSRREIMKSNEQALQRGIRGMAHTEFGNNQSTTIYPHMGLGVNQRFGSKGAYLVHFDSQGKLVADSDWLVP
jgi:cytochrome c553